jgi:tetratricopeptide (TPR) repeat protein
LKKLTHRLGAGKNTAIVGPAGLGKTALAAEAVRAIVGKNAAKLVTSPFPDGVVFLDLYNFHGQAELTWNTLANKLAGAEFMERSPTRERATEVCRARRVLIILEGGEEADGKDGRSHIWELLNVLSPENRWLLLTRLINQAAPAESVEVNEALHPEDAAMLLDSLTKGRVTEVVRDHVLGLLEGHPLALTWAGSLLAREDDDPGRLVADWQASQLPSLNDPRQAEHTLEWLFSRSVRGLDDAARQTLAAAGLLARTPFPLTAIKAALGVSDLGDKETARGAVKSLVQSGLLRRSREPDHWQFTHVLGYRFSRKEIGSEPALRERLGHWLRGELMAALVGNTAHDGPDSLTRTLEHCAALLRADNDNQLWGTLANYILYESCDRLEKLGRLTLERLSLGAFEGWLDRFAPGKAQEPTWLRVRSIMLIRMGDVLRMQGDLARALSAYRGSLTIVQQLAAIDRSNAEWQRDVSLAQGKVGNVLSAQGDLAGALSAYRESLTTSQWLVALDPSNTEWQRDLGVSHTNVGHVLRTQGDLAGALSAYKEDMTIAQRIAAADPSNAEWQRDVCVSQNNVGQVLLLQGDLAGALSAYRWSLTIVQQLAAADPLNAERQRDVCVNLDTVGDLLVAQGDLTGAQLAYRESLTTMQRLAATDQSNAERQRDLSMAQNKVGNVQRVQGDLAGALVVYRESLKMRRWLAEADPSNAEWQRDLGVILSEMGNVLSAQGDLAGAQSAYQESLTIMQRLTAVDPSNATWRSDIPVILTRIAEAYERQGDRTEACRFAQKSLEIVESLAALDPTNATWQQNLANSHNLVARLRS